jgi:c-di-GMP-binding flagellar brake protein YcgR
MEENKSNQERRGSERVDAAFTLIYSVENPYSLRISLGLADDIDAIMVNLSESGMAIITRHDLPIGSQLYIKFNIIDLRLEGEERRRHMEIVAESVSNVRLPKASHRIGIRFTRISNEDKEAIKNFVKRNKFPSL